jgi:hypothetical protein
VIHSFAFFKLLLSSFFLSSPSYSHYHCHFKLLVDSWQRNKQNGRRRRIRRYYIVFFVHCPTTDVKKKRARENRERENEE